MIIPLKCHLLFTWQLKNIQFSLSLLNVAFSAVSACSVWFSVRKGCDIYILFIMLEVILSVKAWDLVPNSRSTLPWSSVVQVSVKEKRLLPYVVAIIWRNATVKSRVEKSFKVHGVTFLCKKNLLRYDRSTCPWSLQVNLHVKIGVEELFPKSEYRISDLTDKNIFVIKSKRKLEKTFL